MDPLSQMWSPSPLQPPLPPVADDATRTRVRWGRVGIAFVAAVIVVASVAGVATGSVATSDTPRAAASTAARALQPASIAATERATTADDQPKIEAAADATATERATSIATEIDAPQGARARAAAVSGGGSATTAIGAAAGPASGADLPYTGAETWIAAILGVIILGLGIALQVNAVRIGMTAMLYRRGILLRPIDCARLASERGIGRLARVWISNALHRLLQEPAGADFVRAH